MTYEAMEPMDQPSAGFSYSNTSFDNISLDSRFLNESRKLMGFQSASTIVMAIISLTVFVIGLMGNTLSIYVVLRYAKMKTITNMYILNLSVADELYILGLPFLTVQNMLSYWPFGSFLCQVVMTTDSINQFTSIFCLTIMSIDRYLAVVHPIRSANWRRPRVARLINGMVWLLSILVVLPVIIFSKVQEDFNTCNISWPEPVNVWSTAFILYTSILGFFGPLLVICLCYLLIIVKVKSAGARAGLANRRKSERKVTRLVVAMVVVFVFCWLPFYLSNIVNLIFILPENSFTAGLYFFTVSLSYVNSCANPVLYGFLSDNFKQSYLKVLCIHRVFGRKKYDPRVPQSQMDRARNSTLPLNNHSFNGHLQNSQVLQEHKINQHFEPATFGSRGSRSVPPAVITTALRNSH